MSVSRDTTTSHDISTDASFRTWIQAIETKMAAAGIVQVTQTGELDPTTVTVPTSNSTLATGFRMYRFADADQGSYPIYFKFQYGRAGAVGRPLITATVGHAIDGSGNFTGYNNAAGTSFSISSSPGTGLIHAAHSHGAFVLALGANYATPSAQLEYGLVLERPRLRDGTIDPDVTIVSSWTGSSTQAAMTRRFLSRKSGWHTSASLPGNYLTGTGVDGADVCLGSFPNGDGDYAHSVAFAPYRIGDIADNTTGTLEVITGSAYSGITRAGAIGLASNGLILLNE